MDKEQAKTHEVEIWGFLDLSLEDRRLVHNFFVKHWNVPKDKLVKKMHLTVYHARRPMLGIATSQEAACVKLPVDDTRFMVMTPGVKIPYLALIQHNGL